MKVAINQTSLQLTQSCLEQRQAELYVVIGLQSLHMIGHQPPGNHFEMLPEPMASTGGQLDAMTLHFVNAML